jgi:hypothetical protein
MGGLAVRRVLIAVVFSLLGASCVSGQFTPDSLVVLRGIEGVRVAAFGEEYIRITDEYIAPVTGPPGGWSGRSATDLIDRIGRAKSIIVRYRDGTGGEHTVVMEEGANALAVSFLRHAVRHGGP